MLIQKIFNSKIKVAISVFIYFSILMTCFETIKDVLASDFSKTQSHLVTILFTSILASAISLIIYKKVSAYKNIVTQNEMQLEVYKSAMSATQHYLNNTLNMFELIKYEFEEDGAVSNNTFQLLQRELTNTQTHVSGLVNLDNPTPENINAHVKQSLYTK